MRTSASRPCQQKVIQHGDRQRSPEGIHGCCVSLKKLHNLPFQSSKYYSKCVI